MTVRILDDLTALLGEHGLRPRGRFNFQADENAPPSVTGRPAASLVLVGQTGAENWPHFQDWLSAQERHPENPLDTWSREVINHVADKVQARAVFPSDKPWLPFQQWAVRAEGLKPSPLGILIHPQFGLWHAYRGALLLDNELQPDKALDPHPCDNCVGKPCLKTCPVSAFSEGGFDSTGCVTHVTESTGNICRDGGCLARNACPVGTQYRYSERIQAFHMAAFVANNRGN